MGEPVRVPAVAGPGAPCGWPGLEERRARILERLPEAARILRDEFGAQRVLVFGSVDAPWFGERSDVDLAVEGLAPSQVHAAERRIARLLETAVDLVRLEEMADSFCRAVEQEGRPVP